jgi:excisionase family DNA binding protein
MGTDHEFMTIGEVADLLRISESTVRSYIRNGKLPCLKLGEGRSAAVRIRRSDIDALVGFKDDDDAQDLGDTP